MNILNGTNIIKTSLTGFNNNIGIQGEQGIQGIPGEQGVQGIRGPKGEADDGNGEISGVGDIFDIIGGILTVVATVTVWGSIQSQLAGLQAQISGIAASIAELWVAIGLIKIDVELLQGKTFFQSVFGTQTKFISDIIISDALTNKIELFNDGSILAIGNIETLSNLECKECICENKLTTDDLLANGIIETNTIQALTINTDLHINSFINQF
jgi:hypothetical protein